jgi:biopolymer transport protein ExbD
MAMGLTGLGRSQSSINVTPLIDVLLVLLIIFMMVAPILTKAMWSDIPRKANQSLPAEYAEKQLVLRVCADGRLLLNREELDSPGLPGRLREVFARRSGRRVIFLDADQDVLYGTVIAVMDLCRDAGAQTIGVIPDSIGVAS